jgi:diguanylate cyclase (GGDEF)-like protein
VQYHRAQSLNEWAAMLDAIYGGSQNYSKSPFEVHAHLTEVCGVFAKHRFKKNDLAKAEEFLPKVFAWCVALAKKVSPQRNDLEEVILRKFPGCCSYCLVKPCKCWSGDKPTVQDSQVRGLFFKNAPSIGRSLNDFQLLFRGIYGPSWNEIERQRGHQALLQYMFIRLIEEVAEVGEAIRFHHLFPTNFENELSDVLAWWFAIATNLYPDRVLLADDLVWASYPGQCPNCQMLPCLCRPGPVRALVSRPVPGQDHRFDSLTSLLNQAAYKEDIRSIEAGEVIIPLPACCARIDVDNFKEVNDRFGHPAGDEALRQIAHVIRRTVRERDRVYRISGDEFGVLFGDFTEGEAAGAMQRALNTLLRSCVRWVSHDGRVIEFVVTISVGVAEFQQPSEVATAFAKADKASYASKSGGRARVSRASTNDDTISLPPAQTGAEAS